MGDVVDSSPASTPTLSAFSAFSLPFHISIPLKGSHGRPSVPHEHVNKPHANLLLTTNKSALFTKFLTSHPSISTSASR